MILRSMFRKVFHALRFAGSEWRKLVVRACYDVSLGKGVYLHARALLVTRDGGRIRIGAHTQIWPGAILDARGGLIEIGEHGLVNAGAYIVAAERVSIGRHALIAEHVTIRDTDHAPGDGEIPSCFSGRLTGPIEIADDVWLAAKVTVTRGVKIGRGAVVGANAVVTRDLAAGGRYGGIPARPLRSSGIVTEDGA